MPPETTTAVSFEAENSQRAVARLREAWTHELRTARRKQHRACFWKALRRTIPFGTYAKLVFLRLMISATFVGCPVLVLIFLGNLENPASVNYNWALFHLAGFGMLLFARAVCVQRWIRMSDDLNMQLKMAAVGLIYNKVFSLTRQSLEKISSHKIIDLVFNEVQKLDLLVRAIGMLLLVPCEIATLLYVIWCVIGWQGVAGTGSFLVVIVCINALARPCSALYKKKNSIARKRIALIGDVIQGIHTIKRNAWEAIIGERVKRIRRLEFTPLYASKVIMSICVALLLVSPSIAALLTSSLLVLTGKYLQPTEAFTFLVAVHVLKVSWLAHFDESMGILADAKITLQKIQSVLEYVTPFFAVENSQNKESGRNLIHLALQKAGKKNGSLNSGRDVVQAQCIHSLSNKLGTGRHKLVDDTTSLSDTNGNPRVAITELTCSWDEQGGNNALENISLDASDGELVVITGPREAGKTSLLMAILKELPAVGGSVTAIGSIAFIPQKPWIVSGTLRENILLGRPFREQKYSTIIRACALRKVFLKFSNGDSTDVGNHGAEMSDSLRARLSLARALYSDADVYLMDDFLSNIDETTAEHIYRACICGLLANRIRFLVTCQAQYLAAANHVLALRRGSVAYQGSYEDALREGNFPHNVLNLENDSVCQTSKETTETAVKGSPISNTEYNDDLVELYAVQLKETGVRLTRLRLLWEYVNTGQPICTICVICIHILLVLFAQDCIIAPSWWLQRMVHMSRDDQLNPLTLMIHSVLVSVALVVTAIVTSCCFHMALRCSQKLHEKMTEAVTKADMMFHDNCHSQHLKAEFLKNFQRTDQELPDHFYSTIQAFLFSVSSLIVPAVVNMWLFLAVVLMSASLAYYGRFHLHFLSESKQNEVVKRSALRSHFRETVTGLEVIRSTETEQRFLQKFYSCLDSYTRALRLLSHNTAWLRLRLDLLWALFITAVASGTVLTGTNSALAGFSLALAMESLAAMQNTFHHASEVHSIMQAIGRVMSYIQLAEEPGYANVTKPPKSWPTKGALEVCNLSLHGRIAESSTSLRAVGFAVREGEHVGVVGREGSDVSSLAAALFRMPEPEGRVVIDGIDISKLNLQESRRCMAFVSKGVMLFPGSVRDSLDPRKEFSDDALWLTLNGVRLRTVIEALPGRLGCDLRESGAELTETQRLLLCLARALLQKTRLLIVEEGSGLNSVVRDVISTLFRTCTVLTIGPCSEPARHVDRLLVVKQGRIVGHHRLECLSGVQTDAGSSKAL